MSFVLFLRAWEDEAPASEKPRRRASTGSAALAGLLQKDKGRGALPSRHSPGIDGMVPGEMTTPWRQEEEEEEEGALGCWGLLLHACCLREGNTVSVPGALKLPVDQPKGSRVYGQQFWGRRE